MQSPIACLSSEVRDELALALNAHKLVLSDDNLRRDWRGVADSFGVEWPQHCRLQHTASPTHTLLHHCRLRSVAGLQCALHEAGRFDAWDQVERLAVRDCQHYQSRLMENSDSLKTPSVKQCTADLAGQFQSPADNDSLLCIGDVECLSRGAPLPQYDALLLYDDADQEFADEIYSRMQAKGVKLCDRARHMLPGVMFEHVGVTRLIEQRCRRVLVVLSPALLQSAINSFLAMFAHAQGLDKGSRMLIPCVHRKCQLPSYLMYCCRLDFTRAPGLVDVWRKMHETLLSPGGRTTKESIGKQVPNQGQKQENGCEMDSGAICADTSETIAISSAQQTTDNFQSNSYAENTSQKSNSSSMLKRIHDRIFTRHLDEFSGASPQTVTCEKTEGFVAERCCSRTSTASGNDSSVVVRNSRPEVQTACTVSDNARLQLPTVPCAEPSPNRTTPRIRSMLKGAKKRVRTKLAIQK